MENRDEQENQTEGKTKRCEKTQKNNSIFFVVRISRQRVQNISINIFAENIIAIRVRKSGKTE